jgi:hypothetical protein
MEIGLWLCESGFVKLSGRQRACVLCRGRSALVIRKSWIGGKKIRNVRVDKMGVLPTNLAHPASFQLGERYSPGRIISIRSSLPFPVAGSHK